MTMVCPPPTGIAAQVTSAAASLSSRMAAPATSSGRPSRPIGLVAAYALQRFGTPCAAARRGEKNQMTDEAVVPAPVHVPAADLTDLHNRLDRTRWPEAELVADWSQGARLASVHAVATRVSMST